jgi:ribosome assembly protein 1
LATSCGPLCAEAVEGVAFVLRGVTVNKSLWKSALTLGTSVSGAVLSTLRDACDAALRGAGPRLLEPIFAVEIQCGSGDVIGRACGVLSKRRGEVVAEEVIEGGGSFCLSAVLPVAESFGFAEEMRTKTSGAAEPQMVFKGWCAIAEEVREEDEGGGEGVEKKYVREVRKRKGLAVEEKVVEKAEKQRNLARKR